ncbi:putative helicase senataxin, partial [Stegodyphus mimosarum]
MNVEYILRQVEPGLADPLIIHLNEEENFIGRQMIPELTKYIKVSRMHGYIKKRGTGFHIRDLGSLNGVYVNGIKIGKELHKLEIGDYIGFGAPSFNDGGFACTFIAKVTSSGEVKREKSALQELEENPQKKIKQESKELEPEVNKALLEDKSVIRNKFQDLKHSEGDGSNLVKIKEEIVENEDIVREDNLKNVSFFSVHESSDKLNKHIFDKYVPSNYEETSGMGSDQSDIFLSSRHSCKEESKINDSTDTKIINKTFKASNAARIGNSVCQTEVKLFKGLEKEVYLSDCSHSVADTKHAIASNIPCFIKEVDLTEKNNLLSVETERAFIKPLHEVHDIRKVPFTDAEEIIYISDGDENNLTAFGNTFERSKEYVEKSNEENLQREHNPNKCPRLVSSKQDKQTVGMTGVHFPNTLNKKYLERKEISKSCGKTLLIEPLPMRYCNLRIRNKGESFREQNNYENINVKERYNVGMISSSRKAGEESMKEIFSRNPNVESKCEQNNDMQEISKLEINLSCASSKVKESNYINASELDMSSVEDKGVSKSPAVAQRRENYGSRISSLVETMLHGKKAFARKTVQKNVNYQIAKKRNHSELVQVMETNIKCIHNEPQGKTYSKKSINNQSECESNVSSVKLQLGSASDNQGKVDLKVTYRDNEAELKFAPLDTRKLTEEPCSSCMSFSKTNLIPTRNKSNIFPYKKKSNLERKDPLSPAQMVNFYSVLEEVLGFDVSSMINNVQESFPFGDVSSLPLCFESLDSYVSLFHLALLAKLWDSICHESKAIIQRSEKDLRKFYMRVLSYKMNNNIMELDCESVVGKLSFCPCEGFVILLHCKDDTQDNYMIGYIKKHSRTLDSQTLTHEWKCLGPKYMDEASIINFTVYMKVQRTYPLCRKLLIANAICHIKSKLILADTFNYLQLSPLCKDILYPREKTFFLSNHSGLPSKPPFSYSPNQAILAISDVINKAAWEPKIIMLHMSSRDKTQTIVGLLQNLLSSNNNKIKVLVTAPSNAAIDKIGWELIEANESYASKSCCIKFVRLGLSKSMHFRLLPHSLDSKATQLYQETMKNEVEFETEELNLLQASIDELKKKQTNVADRNIEQKLQFLTNQYECLKRNNNSDNFLSHSAHMKYKLSVLRDSNVILSTLGSSTQSMLMSAVGPHSETCFTCCIVDEATKCTELEILQPLRLGFNKLVLFGNINEKQHSFSSG